VARERGLPGQVPRFGLPGRTLGILVSCGSAQLNSHSTQGDNPDGDERPDPDRLLAQVQAEEARAQRGRLRVFFGASAGVGKTYAMLEAALVARASGTDVVVGYVEPHGRHETERLLETLECLPTQPVRYRGMVRQQFDLDAALRRRPEILLVDELAHSNLIDGDPPPRHAKRWQDINELCDAGINVWTTLNIQHLESLNDLIAQITGVRQRETIPDRVLDEADEIELIDLPPDDLLQRLRQGKVYVSDQVGTAVERFFRRAPDRAANRLRRTADRRRRAAQGPPGGSRAYLARDRLLAPSGRTRRQNNSCVPETAADASTLRTLFT
jgi:two-component system sensor histidine kinase KdpD